MTQSNLEKFKSGDLKPNIVKFSHNWNRKLDNGFFTTIRKPEVHFKYYSLRLNEKFDVLLNGKLYCQAMLLDSNVKSIDEITPELLVLDTGTTDYKKLFERFGVKTDCCLLLFKRLG